MLEIVKDINAIVLRPFTLDDMDFLQEVYGSTRKAELDQVNYWSSEQKSAFISHQFNAQHKYYLEVYKNAFFCIIEKDNKRVGRLYYDENYENGIRIIDITIHPDFRCRGIGNKIFKLLFEKARLLGKSITIHVESFNPAKQWYGRMGFKMISETNGVYHLMQWG